jgi:hypothetical protein
LRNRRRVGRPIIGAVKARVPALPHAGEQPLEGGPVTTAALPVNQLA